MKSHLLWILLFLLQIPLCSLAEQTPWLDSLHQKINHTPDSLKGPDWVNLGQYYWEQRQENEGYADSLFKYGRIAYETGVTFKDTNTIKNGLTQLYNYHLFYGKDETVDSLSKLVKTYKAEYGYQLPGYFDNYNQEIGYGYAHIYNTLYLYDATGREADFEMVSDSAFRDSFEVNTSAFGTVQPESVFWLKLRLRGAPLRTDDYLFMIGYDSYSWGRAEIYIPDETGTYQKYLSGNKIDPADKPSMTGETFLRYISLNKPMYGYILRFGILLKYKR